MNAQPTVEKALLVRLGWRFTALPLVASLYVLSPVPQANALMNVAGGQIAQSLPITLAAPPAPSPPAEVSPVAGKAPTVEADAPPLLEREATAAEPPAPSQPAAAHVEGPRTGLDSLPLVTEPAFAAPPRPPVYPTIARKRGQQGTVWLEVWLDDTGRQLALRVSRSSGLAVLDRSALEAVQHWQFKPYQVAGEAMASRVRLPIRFSLN